MLPLSKHIGTGFGKGELFDVLTQLQNMAVPITQTQVYYVSKGGNNVDGLSWETAFTTLTAAITAQRAMRDGLPSAQKSVNTYIIIAPGTYDEKITSFAMSTTYIGLGIPGTDKAVEIHPSTDGAVMAGTVSGVRFINIRFEATGAYDLLDFEICNNVEILNCDFQCNALNKNAISTENSGYLTVRGCRIGTGGLETFEYGIYAAGGADKHFHNAIIEDNIIQGLDAAGTGIYISGDAENSQTIIRNNVIKLTGAGTGISIGATGSGYKQAMVIGNIIFTQGGTGITCEEDLAGMNFHNDGTNRVAYPTQTW